jgi:hypothetical protein
MSTLKNPDNVRAKSFDNIKAKSCDNITAFSVRPAAAHGRPKAGTRKGDNVTFKKL